MCKFRQFWCNNWTLMANQNVFNQTFIYFQLNMHYSDKFENSQIIVTQVTFINGTYQVLLSCKRIECRQLKPTWHGNSKSLPLSPMAIINHSILYLKLIRLVGLKGPCVVGKQTCQPGGQPAPVLMDFLFSLLQGNAHVS